MANIIVKNIYASAINVDCCRFKRFEIKEVEDTEEVQTLITAGYLEIIEE